MDKTTKVIRDLRKAPLRGDVYQLDENNYVTIISAQEGEVRYYAIGAVEVSAFRDLPDEELRRTTHVMPDNVFRKWLATIAARRRMATPPPWD